MKTFSYALITLSLLIVGPSAVAQMDCEAGVQYYTNGGIKSCVLTSRHQVYTAQGTALVCADGKAMAQHPTGKLKSCTLKYAQSVDHQNCAAGTKVEFGDKGQLVACQPS